MFIRNSIFSKMILKTRYPLVSKENINKLRKCSSPSKQLKSYNNNEKETERQTPEEHKKSVDHIIEEMIGFNEKNNTFYGNRNH
jgi:hypothetical protein